MGTSKRSQEEKERQEEMNILREYIREILSENICPLPKAIFMAGAPGAGKSTVIRRLGLKDQLKVINPDDTYEESLKAAGIPLDVGALKDKYDPIKAAYLEAVESGDTKTAESLEPDYLALRGAMSQNMKLFAAARKAAKERQESLECQMENFLVDGTGGAFKQISNQVKRLRDMGYDVGMIFIDVPKEISVQRNIARGESGDRSISTQSVERSWESVNKNKEPYRELFGNNFFYIDASEVAFDESIDSAAPRVNSFLNKSL